MPKYRVNFYKTLMNSNGRVFTCLERQTDVTSDSPGDALVLAEKRMDLPVVAADRIEVIHLSEMYYTNSLTQKTIPLA